MILFCVKILKIRPKFRTAFRELLPSTIEQINALRTYIKGLIPNFITPPTADVRTSPSIHNRTSSVSISNSSLRIVFFGRKCIPFYFFCDSDFLTTASRMSAVSSYTMRATSLREVYITRRGYCSEVLE